MYDTGIIWTTVWLSADNHCGRPTVYAMCSIAYVCTYCMYVSVDTRTYLQNYIALYEAFVCVHVQSCMCALCRRATGPTPMVPPLSSLTMGMWLKTALR